MLCYSLVFVFAFFFATPIIMLFKSFLMIAILTMKQRYLYEVAFTTNQELLFFHWNIFHISFLNWFLYVNDIVDICFHVKNTKKERIFVTGNEVKFMVKKEIILLFWIELYLRVDVHRKWSKNKKLPNQFDVEDIWKWHEDLQRSWPITQLFTSLHHDYIFPVQCIIESL